MITNLIPLMILPHIIIYGHHAFRHRAFRHHAFRLHACHHHDIHHDSCLLVCPQVYLPDAYHLVYLMVACLYSDELPDALLQLL